MKRLNVAELEVIVVPAITEQASIQVLYRGKEVMNIGMNEIDRSGLTSYRKSFRLAIRQSLITGVIEDAFEGTSIGRKLKAVIDAYGEEENYEAN